MISKTLALIALIALPLNLALWHKSHGRPEHFRWDITPYQSLRVALAEGKCAIRLFTMPTKTNIKGEFRGQLVNDPTPGGRSLLLSSVRSGDFRTTWLVFPFWLSASILAFFAAVPVMRGPVRLWWRKSHGWCVECGYDLRGTRGKRCSECGTHFR